MTSALPPLGLLLDVDGPIASPVTRSIALPSITRDLVALANLGVPIAFNTGRSDAFIRDQVVKPMLAAGLAPDARVYGICEKGAVWFGATMALFDGIVVDEAVRLPEPLLADLRVLVESEFADVAFWDPTKHAMASIEQRTDVANDVFLRRQPAFDAAAFDLIEHRGFGVVHLDRRSDREVTVRIDPTIISTDVESVALGKDLGARRALDLLAESGPIPTLWRTVGDSRSDYAMADHLHDAGFDVAHVDVRPADGIPEKPYRIVTEGDLIHDAAGAAFLSYWVERLT
ncbi:MAG: hypothetical protein RI885_2401 [Actinomycetota bacterium]